MHESEKRLKIVLQDLPELLDLIEKIRQPLNEEIGRLNNVLTRVVNTFGDWVCADCQNLGEDEYAGSISDIGPNQLDDRTCNCCRGLVEEYLKACTALLSRSDSGAEQFNHLTGKWEPEDCG